VIELDPSHVPDLSHVLDVNVQARCKRSAAD
jgi:hypothetical protein